MNYCEKCRKEILGNSLICDDCKKKNFESSPPEEKSNKIIKTFLIICLIIPIIVVTYSFIAKSIQKNTQKIESLDRRIESLETEARILRYKLNSLPWRN